MTSIATFFGALPLALATGPGSKSRAVLGIVILEGVLGATLITLLTVPGLYRLAARVARRAGRYGKAARR